MALLVPNIGELESLRYLVNQSNHVLDREDTAPRDLLLKLCGSNTVPSEGDIPSETAYYEPYADGNTNTYGVAPSTGYPSVVNNRTESRYNYSDQYGILLNGSRWKISTAADPVASSTGASGSQDSYEIIVTGLTGTISVGNVVSGTGIAVGAKVARVDGTTIILTVKNAGDVSGAITFGGGVTTAAYPEQTFTFSSAAGNIYGYHIVRANNMPVEVHGVADAAVAAAGTQLTKGDSTDVCIGVIGNDFITLPNVAAVMDDVTLGMLVGGNAAVPESTYVGGIDRALRRIYLLDDSLQPVLLTDNIQGATDPSITLDYSVVSTGAENHQLQSGDIIYIARGTGNTTTTANTYTVRSIPTGSTFTTSPALSGTGNLTLYSSIMFSERFTNGPYPIQNDGDQIKVTLNISLDWFYYFTLKNFRYWWWVVIFPPPFFWLTKKLLR